VVPDAEFAGDLQPVQRFPVPGMEFVGGLVAFDAQRVEQADYVAIQLDLAAELVEQIRLGGGGIELDAGSAGQILRQSLAQLAQLDQRGVGIAGEDLLGGAGKLQEQRVVFLEEGEVTADGHARSLAYCGSGKINQDGRQMAMFSPD